VTALPAVHQIIAIRRKHLGRVGQFCHEARHVAQLTIAGPAENNVAADRCGAGTRG
jgi:hypothetical protein